MSADIHPTEPPDFFSAFRPERRERRRWIIPAALGIFAIAALMGVAIFWPDNDAYRVLTSKGARRLPVGSSVQEVRKILGAPFYSHKENGRECFKYGSPTFETAAFLVYTACFEGGQLNELTHRKYTADEVVLPNTGTGGAPQP